MTKSEYAAVPLDVLKFLANLSSVFAAAGLSNALFEYEAKLIQAELDMRQLNGELPL